MLRPSTVGDELLKLGGQGSRKTPSSHVPSQPTVGQRRELPPPPELRLDTCLIQGLDAGSHHPRKDGDKNQQPATNTGSDLGDPANSAWHKADNPCKAAT
jgi:hypothetical protein